STPSRGGSVPERRPTPPDAPGSVRSSRASRAQAVMVISPVTCSMTTRSPRRTSTNVSVDWNTGTKTTARKSALKGSPRPLRDAHRVLEVDELAPVHALQVLGQEGVARVERE